MTGLDAHLPALQVIIPLLMAPVVVLLRPKGLAWAAASATSVMAFTIAVHLALAVLGGEPLTYQMGSWPAPYGIELRVDAFSALLLLVITGASSLALLAGRKSLAADIVEDRDHYFFSTWLLAVAGLAGIAVSADAFNIFVFMEISSLASYILIAGGPDRRALTAVFKYLIMGTIGATFYLIGIGLIYMMTGTLNLQDIALRLAPMTAETPILAAAGFITVGLALKAAIFPLHVWLPNAYTYAPHIVTAFLAACATKLSVYVLMRFDFFVFGQDLAGEVQLSLYLLPLAILSILIGSGVAMFERDMKRLLAFSSVAQIGYIVLGASLATVTGLTAATLHMFNHALAKGGLFLSIAAFAVIIAGSGVDRIAGMARRMPVTFAALTICGLSLIGVPGTAGFISKWYLIQAALELGALGMALVAVILISSLMAVVYVWRIVESACFAVPSEKFETNAPISRVLLVVTWVVALANVYFGLMPALPLELSQSAAEVLLGGIG